MYQTYRRMREELKILTDILLNTPNMEQRTVGVGVLAKDIARDFSPVGPMIRGSGFARDVRKVHPFSGYGVFLSISSLKPMVMYYPV